MSVLQWQILSADEEEIPTVIKPPPSKLSLNAVSQSTMLIECSEWVLAYLGRYLLHGYLKTTWVLFLLFSTVPLRLRIWCNLQHISRI